MDYLIQKQRAVNEVIQKNILKKLKQYSQSDLIPIEDYLQLCSIMNYPFITIDYLQINDVPGRLSYLDQFLENPSETFQIKPLKYNFLFCCNSPMQINHRQNQLICFKCGRSKIYRDILFEQPKINIKIQSSPIRNFQKHLHCLFDDVSDEIQLPIKILSEAKLTKFSPKILRKEMQNRNISKYNNYLSQIIQFFDPSQRVGISTSQKKIVEQEYLSILSIYKNQQIFNLPYCPYIINGIIQEKFGISILHLLNIQGKKSIKKFNKHWEVICKKKQWKFREIGN